MNEIKVDENFIKSNFEKTLSLVDSIITGERKERLKNLLDHFGQQYMLCPASSKKEYYSCFPGGLCYHNLNTLKWSSKLNDVLCGSKHGKDSLLVISILHEFGKVGDLNEDYYIEQDAWHKERGMYYEINKNIRFMTIEDRSLYHANEYGIGLTPDEFIAIRTHGGQLDETSTYYKYKEPELAKLFFMADQWAIIQEKQTNFILA